MTAATPSVARRGPAPAGSTWNGRADPTPTACGWCMEIVAPGGLAMVVVPTAGPRDPEDVRVPCHLRCAEQFRAMCRATLASTLGA